MTTYTLNGPVLTVTDVTLARGDVTVLNGVSFVVHDVVRPNKTQGQIVALLGPSGCGKTTLFRCIAGLERPDSGTILVGLKQVPTSVGRVGVVMQHYPLFMHRTVLGNLLVASTDRIGAEALLATFGLGDRKDAYPAELSGGQRQRVAIAQQLMGHSGSDGANGSLGGAMILMDEPFSGLDPTTKDKACELIEHVASLHEENTIVIVTHDIESAVRIADQVIVLGRREAGTGACVRADIDLKARGIAWHDRREDLPAFVQTVREIKAMFPTL